jgi:hypothetical protein
MLDDLPLEAMTVGYETCSGLFADRLTKSPTANLVLVEPCYIDMPKYNSPSPRLTEPAM